MEYDSPLVAIAVVVALLLIARWRIPSQIRTTREGAVLALSQVLEWSKWMSGIQTAAIGGLALLVFDKDFDGINSCVESMFMYSAFACLGAALYCSAWVLGSLPSLSIRVHSIRTAGLHESHDIYEMPLFAWSSKLPFSSSKLPLGYVLSANHWLWGGGLLSLALFAGSQLLSRA